MTKFYQENQVGVILLGEVYPSPPTKVNSVNVYPVPTKKVDIVGVGVCEAAS